MEQEQIMILVDEKGNPTGEYRSRIECHTAEGYLHLAVQAVVFNKDWKAILHSRPAKKVGGGKLDAPTTHVLKGESPEQAIRRCLSNEYRIEEKIELKVREGIYYKTKFEDNKCENEFLIPYFGTYSGEIKPNKEEIDSIILKDFYDLLVDIENNSQNYTAWLPLTVNRIK